jgi:hypothetical protein
MEFEVRPLTQNFPRLTSNCHIGFLTYATCAQQGGGCQRPSMQFSSAFPKCEEVMTGSARKFALLMLATDSADEIESREDFEPVLERQLAAFEERFASKTASHPDSTVDSTPEEPHRLH